MATATTTSTIPIKIQGFYDRNLLERSLGALLYSKFGQTRPLPKNSGDDISFRKYGSLVKNTTQLTEGITPSGKQLSVSKITATMGQYGDFVLITDKLLDMGLDPILVEAGEILGEQAGLSIDQIHAAILLAGSSVRYANGVAGRSSIINPIQEIDIEVIVRNFYASNARVFRSMNTPGVKVGTTPLRPGFLAITHTDCRQDFEGMTHFIPIEKYPSQQDVLPEEIGEIKGVRVLATTNAGLIPDAGGTAVTNDLIYTTANTACDVYQTLFLAKDAYGVVPLQKGNIENIIKKANSSGTEDPLNQRNTSGWKAYTTAKILNENFIYRCEHGVSDL